MKTAPEVSGRELVIYTSVDGDAGSGVLRDGSICDEESECGCVIHFNATYYGPL